MQHFILYFLYRLYCTDALSPTYPSLYNRSKDTAKPTTAPLNGTIFPAAAPVYGVIGVLGVVTVALDEGSGRPVDATALDVEVVVVDVEVGGV